MEFITGLFGRVLRWGLEIKDIRKGEEWVERGIWGLWEWILILLGACSRVIAEMGTCYLEDKLVWGWVGYFGDYFSCFCGVGMLILFIYIILGFLI